MVYCERSYRTSHTDILIALSVHTRVCTYMQQGSCYRPFWLVRKGVPTTLLEMPVVQGPMLVRCLLCESVHVYTQEWDAAGFLCGVKYLIIRCVFF